MQHWKQIRRRFSISGAFSLLFVLSPLVSAKAMPRSGCITGTIEDAETHEVVNWASVTILELDRSEPSHNDGTFTFCQVPEGSYTVSIEHIGYRPFHADVRLASGDTAYLTISLQPTALQTEEIVVKAKRSENGLVHTRASESLSGAQLQAQLAGTLAETIENEPGMARQSMGPATSRPVMRGLGGDRLVILEDGSATGDASAISADHAVTADPMTAEKIEILRGPASFLYSSNALGGVINMEREKTLGNRPDRVHGTAGIQGESVNNGYSVGTSLGIPAGPLGVQLQASYRNAGDLSTPSGTLGSTDIETFDGSVGLNWLFSQGSVNAAAGLYQSEYGVPGGFTGAHPEGVRISMDRRELKTSADYHLTEQFLNRVRAQFAYTRYHHKELEAPGIIGTEYGILTSSGSLQLHHDALASVTDRGILSVQGTAVDFAANGVRIPQTDERALGISLFEEKQFDDIVLTGALRYDINTMTPSSYDTTAAGIITGKTFSGVSGSLSLDWSLTPSFSLGFSALHTFRSPTVEELFSDGPHLASYSYEVGNTELTAEKGIGLEASARFSTDAGSLRLSVYRNAIEDYVFPRATGDTNYRTLLPIYQHTGEEVVLQGGEFTMEWQLIDRLTGSGTISYVNGNRTGTDTPLPFIPPLNGSMSIRWNGQVFIAGITARMADAQNRVGEFEEATDGYIVTDISAQYRIIGTTMLHAFVLGVDNVFDTTYRNHLSRTKEIMPEPGRNLRLLYRLYF